MQVRPQLSPSSLILHLPPHPYYFENPKRCWGSLIRAELILQPQKFLTHYLKVAYAISFLVMDTLSMASPLWEKYDSLVILDGSRCASSAASSLLWPHLYNDYPVMLKVNLWTENYPLRWMVWFTSPFKLIFSSLFFLQLHLKKQTTPIRNLCLSNLCICYLMV